ncbi:hypothetical protein H2203_003503 [Taxawa tesnikishii (nom. ined.)]|nr:hypothetical protein H2203_003503 [Dothideales sp. JES 119]
MVSTRSMASKATNAPDTENDQQPNLRKKPIRRATTKASTTKSTKKLIGEEPKPKPLSPKKITQVARARTTRTALEPRKQPVAAQTKRPVRRAAAVAQKTLPTRTRRAASVIQNPEPVVEADERACELEPEVETGKGAGEEKQTPSNHEEAVYQSVARTEKLGIVAEKDEEHEVVYSTPVRTHCTRDQEAHSTPKPAKPAPEEEPASSERTSEEDENEEKISAPEPALALVKTPKATPYGKMPAQKVWRTTSRKARRSKIEMDGPDVGSEDELCGTTRSGLENGSDDELCGPKTPMRRGSPVRKPITSAKTPGQPLYTFKTPAQRLKVLGTNRGTPQTQKVPTKLPAPDTVQRPMTAVRGSSAAHVFQPLPKSKATQALSPMHAPPSSGDYFNVGSAAASSDPEEDEEDVNETVVSASVDEDADELEAAQSPLAHTPFIDRTTTLRRTRDSGQAQAEDAEEEELLQSDEERTLQIDPAYSPVELSEDSEDEDENAMTMITEQPASWRRLDVLEGIEDGTQRDPEPSLSIDSVEDDEGETVQPEFSSEFFASSLNKGEGVDPDESGVVPSPVSQTLVSAFKQSLTEHATRSNDSTPASGLSLRAGEPRLPSPSVTAELLQTPHMRSFEELAVAQDAEEPIQDGSEAAELTVCIDPALLSLPPQQTGFSVSSSNAVGETPISKLTRQAEQHVQPDVDTSVPDVQQSTPTLTRFIAKQIAMPKMISRIQDGSTAEHVATGPLNVEREPALAGDRKERTEPKAAAPGPVEQSPQKAANSADAKDEVEDLSSIPHYARSTIAYDVRRKSMPVDAVSTPKSTLRPRTADTAIKPSTSDAFAQLWAARSKKCSNQASSPKVATPAQSLCNTPLPTRTRKMEQAPVVPSARKLPPPSTQRKSVPHIQHATPEIAHTGPRPRAYTPTLSVSRPATRTPNALKTPIKTPLKPPALTPGSYPMTPHPAQPLKGLTCLVEVFTLEGASASSPFIALLHRLGARTTKSWSERVTHVVFKDGSPATLQRVRLVNKEAVFCVNSRWVTDCDRLGTRMDERSDKYAVDLCEVPRAGRRRRKSMEPASLRNLDGNVVKASVLTPGRKSAAARKDTSWLSTSSSVWEPSPVKGGLIGLSNMDGDEENGFWDADASFVGTPTTPGTVNGNREWKVQQTAPVNKITKLRFGDEKGNRRLTFWPRGKGEEEMED